MIESDTKGIQVDAMAGIKRRDRRALLDRAIPYLLAAGVLVIQQIFFSVPLGIFIRGVIVGLLTALIALGMALIYRSNRFINFAQGDLGTIPVVLVVMLMFAWGWPYLLAVPVGLVAALVLGGLVELVIIRRFFHAPRLLVTVASLGLSQLLAGCALLLPRLWGAEFPLLGQRLQPPFDLHLDVGTVVFDANDVIAIIAAPLALIALAIFLRASSVGIAIRASADGADTASLLGVPVKRLQTVVWAVAALLAFVAIFLRAGIIGLPISGALSLGILLKSLGAMVMGRMTNLLAIGVNAIALGILEIAVGFTASSPLLLDPILAVIIVVALFIVPRSRSRVDEAEGSTWRSADDVRPIPASVARINMVRLARYGLATLFAVTLVVLPFVLPVDASLKASAVIIYAILGLSIVVLTGWAGQVSLGQVAFFAIGATLGAKATVDWGLDLLLALVLSAAVVAVIAVLVGIPALRRRGFYLAVTTLAFSLAVTSYFLNSKYFKWVPQGRIPRPPLFGTINITSATAIYFLVLAVLALCLLGLRGIHRSRTGRAILALRDNERGAEAFGINATRVRLTAFALSGALAGLAGCLFAHHQQAIGSQPFEPFENLLVLTMVIIGGVATPAGAVIGALYFQGLYWFLPGKWQALASGIGTLLVLMILPDGIGGLLFRLRDRWLARMARHYGVEAPGLAASPPPLVEEAPPDDALVDAEELATAAPAGDPS